MYLSKIRHFLRILYLIFLPHFFVTNMYGQIQLTECPTCIANALGDSNDLLDTPFPPKDLEGKQKFNRFKIVNIITWKKPSCGVEPVSYEIYRDASLTKRLGTVSANSELKFKDKVRGEKNKFSYFLVSVDAEGRKSVLIGIVFKGGKTHITPPDLPVQTLLIKPHFSPLSTGDQVQLETYAVLADCSLHRVTHLTIWGSSDRTIVDIDQNGNATGIRPGVASINAQVGETFAKTSLTVTDDELISIDIVLFPIERVSSCSQITPTTEASVLVGDTLSFYAIGRYSSGGCRIITDSVNWNSSIPGIVSFSNNVLEQTQDVKGENAGTTTITASLGTVISSGVKFNAFSLDQLEGISIAVDSNFDQIVVGGNIVFKAVGIFPNNVQIPIPPNKVSWFSSNPLILDNLSNIPYFQVFTGINRGIAEVSARAGNMTSNSITVQVFSLNQLTAITVIPSSRQVSLSNVITSFQAVGSFHNNLQADISQQVNWSSSNPSVASNTFANIFSLNAVGTTDIIASGGNVQGKATLEVFSNTP